MGYRHYSKIDYCTLEEEISKVCVLDKALRSLTGKLNDRIHNLLLKYYASNGKKT